MSDAGQNIWIYAKITLATLADGTTRTFNVSNRPIPTGTFGSFIPMLKQISKLQTGLDQFSVTTFSGSIIINDSIGSYGYLRKFSDLFERETVVDQPIEIYTSQTELSSSTPSWSLIFKGYALNARRENGELEIAIESRAFERRFINRILQIDDFQDTPVNTHVGQALPVVFGSDVQVKPLLIGSSITPTWAYATIFSGAFPVGGVQTYYARDLDGNYSEVVSASDKDTAVLSNATAAAYNVIISVNEPATWLNITYPTDSYIITAIDIEFNGQGSARTGSGVLTVNIYEGIGNDPLRGPGERVATGTLDYADYASSFSSASDFYLSFPLNKPLPLNNGKGYFVSVIWSGTMILGSAPEATASDYGTDNYCWARVIDGSATDIWQPLISTMQRWKLRYKLYGVEITDVPSGTVSTAIKGLKYAYFYAEQKAIASEEEPNISEIDWIIETDGLKDDGSGNITGSANALLEYPHHQIKMLSYSWSGSSWGASSDWDFSTYSSSHAVFAANHLYERKTSGATSGIVLVEQLAREICRNSACRISYTNAGKLAVWAWGLSETVQSLLQQDDAKVISYEILDQSQLLNYITLSYGRIIQTNPQAAQLIAQGFNSDSVGSLTWDAETNSLAAHLISESQTNFGERPLQDSAYTFIQTAAYAELLAKFFLARFSVPAQYVDVEMPLPDGATLKLLDVVQIQSPELPTYYGATYAADAVHWQGYSGDILRGENLTSAKTYRAQIEGRAIDVFSGRGPILILRCKLLLNYPKDPT